MKEKLDKNILIISFLLVIGILFIVVLVAALISVDEAKNSLSQGDDNKQTTRQQANSENNNNINDTEKEEEIVLPEIVSTCTSEFLGIKLNSPVSADCNTDVFNEELELAINNTENDVNISIFISSLGRGPYCFNEEGCEVEVFFESTQEDNNFKINRTIVNGELVEIWGGIGRFTEDGAGIHLDIRNNRNSDKIELNDKEEELIKQILMLSEL